MVGSLRGRAVHSLTRWLARILLALVVAVVSAELFLQAASLVARTVSARGSLEAAAAGTGEVVAILCVGDSHTYGLPLPQQHSYPSQLEAALSEHHPNRSFQVVNLGIPGTNSGYVANRLERQMLQLGARLVIVWVGINNQWNVVESRAANGRDPWLGVRKQLLRSRLYRLASIAWYTRTGHQYDMDQHGGWFEGELAPSGRRPAGARASKDPAPGLADDIQRMVETARSLDVPIAFVTYPMRTQRAVNGVIERAVFENEALLIDGNREFERAVRSGEAIRDLVDLSAGPHPTERLYGHIVESMLPVVEEALGLDDS